MLRKLVKYELKSIYKFFFVLYAIIIAASITFISTIKTSSDALEVLGFSSGLLCMFGMIALSVGLLVFTITRFNRSLLGDEGYLMFTIPTSTHNIIWSKAIAILIFNLLFRKKTCIIFKLLSVFVVVLVMILIAYFIGDFNFSNVDEGFIEVVNMAFKKPGTYLVIVLAIVHILVSIISSTMLIYASISFGQMPAFKKHKNISAIGFFVVFSIVSEYIMTKLGYAGLDAMFSSFNARYYNLLQSVDQTNISQTMNDVIEIATQYSSHFLLSFLGLSLIVLAVEYIITYYILDKKLNLD